MYLYVYVLYNNVFIINDPWTPRATATKRWSNKYNAIIDGMEAIFTPDLTTSNAMTLICIQWSTSYNWDACSFSHRVYILFLHLTLVPVPADSTRPRRDVGQGPHILVGGHRSGRKRKIDIMFVLNKYLVFSILRLFCIRVYISKLSIP